MNLQTFNVIRVFTSHHQQASAKLRPDFVAGQVPFHIRAPPCHVLPHYTLIPYVTTLYTAIS